MEATIALAGNPNSGKTTLFNALTGSRQHVGNYPGVTVEKKSGTYTDDGMKATVVDLPGTYSLTAYSLEEVVARDYLVDEKPAVIVDIVDAANLERNLYLTIQFMEMGLSVCIALNMIDVAKGRGIDIDTKRLSSVMGVPVVPTVARKGTGKDELMAVAAEMIQEKTPREPLNISYGADVDATLDEMVQLIQEKGLLTDRYPARWVALKYLERDTQILERGADVDSATSAKLGAITERLARHLQKTDRTDPEAVIADYRYGYIHSLVRQNILTYREDPDRLLMTDRIDRVLTDRLLGPTIMLAVIYGLYQCTFTYSEVPVGWMEGLFGWLGGLAEAWMPDGLLKSLVISGMIDGVGGVMGFVPLIVFMFFGVSILEDSGYLARVAFMLDRVFRMFGLHGASVMAFIVSGGIAGGCAVPGVMATRTLRSPRERLATLLTAPFMNCGAKLPVFALLVAAFFTDNEATVMMVITFVAWAGALIIAKVLRSTVIKGEATPFVMELPPYRMPTLRGLLIHTWERTWQYIKKAGTVILGISILLWALMTFPGLPDADVQQFENKRGIAMVAAGAATVAELEAAGEEVKLSEAAASLQEAIAAIDGMEAEAALRHSIAGRIGIALESISRLAGFDWRTNIALLGGFAAKEVIVSTLGTAYSMGEVDPEETGSLSDRLASAQGWSPLVALSLIVFTIFYAPCLVTVVCIAREAGSWKWGAFSMIFNTIVAFTLAVLVYQAGSLVV